MWRYWVNERLLNDESQSVLLTEALGQYLRTQALFLENSV